jgi:hypothetical protein
MMVDDMQPREEQINAETERAFRAFITSTKQGLSSLPTKLEGSSQTSSSLEHSVANEQQDSTEWIISSRHLTDASETWSTKLIPSPLGSLTDFSKLDPV